MSALELSRPPASRAASWLALGATPTFALMAAICALAPGPDMICGAMAHAAVPGGMAPMYALMSAFHLTPWLRLLSGR